MKTIKHKIWLIPCPGVGIRAVFKEFWWKKLLVIRKVIYRDLDKTCQVDWLVCNEEIYLRDNI